MSDGDFPKQRSPLCAKTNLGSILGYGSLKSALVPIRLDHVAAPHRKTRVTCTKCNVICGGVNVGDAFRQVEGLVTVSGSESA